VAFVLYISKIINFRAIFFKKISDFIRVWALLSFDLLQSLGMGSGSCDRKRLPVHHPDRLEPFSSGPVGTQRGWRISLFLDQRSSFTLEL